MQTDKSIELLQVIRGEKPSTAGGSTTSNNNNNKAAGGAASLHIVKVITASPEVTIVFEGSSAPLGDDIFEIPIRFQPVEEGSRYFALPIVGGHRWGIIEKLDGEEVTGSFLSKDDKTITVTNGIVEKIE